MSEQLYDLSQLNELAGGSQEFVQTMIDTFIEHTPEQFNSMKAAFEQQDYKTMGDLAHKIKPSIDLFQIKDMGETIRSIERQGKNMDPLPDLGTQISELGSILFTAMDQLKNS